MRRSRYIIPSSTHSNHQQKVIRGLLTSETALLLPVDAALIVYWQWFLLLGATSATSGMLNVWLLQWPIVQCCRIVVRPS